jgi:hypothetical protein
MGFPGAGHAGIVEIFGHSHNYTYAHTSYALLNINTHSANLLCREADIAIRMVRPEQGTLVVKEIGNEVIGGEADTAILDGFQAMGYPVGADAFALRTDDLIVQWQAVHREIRTNRRKRAVYDFLAEALPSSI